MVYGADDLGAWLVSALADAGRRKLTTFVLGTDQERELRRAAADAVGLTAQELHPDDHEQAGQLALVISHVFGEPVPDAQLAGHDTVLEALHAGIAGQLAVLDDASVTGTGVSSSEVLGVTGTVLAKKLTANLLREISVRGSGGGPLSPLASQLNHDVTHLQVRRLGGVVDQRADEILGALARLGGPRTAPAAPTALAQLPAPIAGFTGRDDSLALLGRLLDPAGTPDAAVVSAVVGMAGVGKTTLAVQAGHAARQRGLFGGGVVFIDLHGYDDAPVEPGQALDALLRALGVPAEDVPSGMEERGGLYRSVLANLTKPVLVIADNASSEAQVRPLMPGGGPHKVLVTSRHILAGLGARLIDLTILDDGASVELLDAAVRAARPGDDRVRGDQKAAGMLAELCSGLPLALQIIAALLNVDPTLSARELAGELAVETERLERLHYDDGAGPDSPSVATAFELSYRRLEQIPSRVFRLLPMNPGPDISTTAAAYLADLPVTKVRKILAELARAHLVEAAPGAAGRWRMHDLLHLYSRQLSDENAEADGREQGIDRLLGYYLTRADAADQHLRTQQGKEIPGEFADRGSALTWLDAERACLIAAVSMAADKGRDQVAMRLPLALAEYLQLRRRLDDWLAIATKSTEAARRLGDRRLESSALVTLSNVLRQLRHFEEAITICQNAVAICRETGDQLCEAGALNNLAGALHETGRLDEAITVQQENLVICRALSDRRGEGKALNNLGLSLRQMGKLDEAVAAHQNAAGLYREMGDRYGVGTAMNNLGIALQEAQRFEEAVVAYQEDLAICQEIGDRYGEATTLNNLGAALGEVGRLAEAIPAFREAAALYGETGERRGEGRAKIHLGVALRLIGLPGEAITVLQEAAAIFQETGDQESDGTALGHLDRISSGGGPDSGNTATSE